jgi:hypothetical protein
MRIEITPQCAARETKPCLPRKFHLNFDGENIDPNSQPDKEGIILGKYHSQKSTK